MIFIRRAEEPEILRSQGQTKQLALCAAYDQGTNTFSFDSGIYAHKTVKEALIAMQHDKCCFCEAKITHISYGDVEHYRPKAGYRQDNSESLQQPGYYWLVYTWDNLLLSCTLCNQQYKKNLFPLLHPEKRVLSHHDDITAEQPLLINPTLINPQDYIGFRAEIPYAVEGNIYGDRTIAILGLDRESLNEKRRSKLAEIALLIDVVKIANHQADNVELQNLAEQTKQYLTQSVLPTAEYSAMVSGYMSEALSCVPEKIRTTD